MSWGSGPGTVYLDGLQVEGPQDQSSRKCTVRQDLVLPAQPQVMKISSSADLLRIREFYFHMQPRGSGRLRVLLPSSCLRVIQKVGLLVSLVDR